MKRLVYCLFAALLFQSVSVWAQDNASAVEKEMAYRKTVYARAAKIVKGLNLSDSTQAKKVTEVVAKQYQDLNDIYVLRDNKKTLIKGDANANKEAVNAKLKAVDEETTAKVDKLHPQYLKRLAKAGLSTAQIDQVKDGMTYNVLNVTYTAYQAMMPNLTDAQKTQILAWLTEAREHSMDAESSEKKHAWFGKYKGRINNYLSQAGIDMKKEEAAWMARIKEEKSAKQQQN